MRPEPLRALVVDDEPLARDDLLRELSSRSDVVVTGCAEDVDAARRLMRDAAPQLVFLDIELADRCGLELLAGAPPELCTIVVSAFEHYALRAFDAQVCDYLLKPVQAPRLAQALQRVRASLQEPPCAESATALGYDDCLFITALDGGAHVVPVERIAAVAADGDYSRILTCDGAQLRVRKPLRDWEARLPAQAFARIHRATLVNLRRVQRVDAWLDRCFRVFLDGLPRPLTMSRRHAHLLRRRMR
jgi:two-component system LytT family response regulator